MLLHLVLLKTVDISVANFISFSRVAVIEKNKTTVKLKQIDFGSDITVLLKDSFFMPSTSYPKSQSFYHGFGELESLMARVDFTNISPGVIPCQCSGDQLVKAKDKYENDESIEFSVESRKTERDSNLHSNSIQIYG